MSGTVTADMGAEALAAQLNAMRNELIAGFGANEDEHDRLRAATEAVKSEVSDLNGRLNIVQLTLSATIDQARALLETMVTESRTALDAIRGESMMALQAAMSKYEADLRRLYDTLSGQVRHDLMGAAGLEQALRARLVRPRRMLPVLT